MNTHTPWSHSEDAELVKSLECSAFVCKQMCMLSSGCKTLYTPATVIVANLTKILSIAIGRPLRRSTNSERATPCARRALQEATGVSVEFEWKEREDRKEWRWVKLYNKRKVTAHLYNVGHHRKIGSKFNQRLGWENIFREQYSS